MRRFTVIIALFAALGSAMSTVPMKVRVVTYNVLSSHLATTTQYPSYNPEHLTAANRLPKVLEKIEAEMKAENVIFCLQEVSYDWAGSLHTFFANKGFHFVTGLYGKQFNGYMGVCLAWPTSSFSVQDVDISRIADKREGGWPEPEVPSLPTRLWTGVQSLLEKPLRALGVEKEEVIDHWSMSQRRFNVMVSAKLEEKKSKRQFAISTYHMPCAFYAPRVMTIHCDLAARHIQRFANDLPYVFAGDFNVKPVDSTYRFLTTGEMDTNDAFYPTPKSGMNWEPQSKPMLSAYAVKNGSEPDFTNYAQSRTNDPFIDTLDYIFVDQENWKVVDILQLKARNEYEKPLPDLDSHEPSDHVVLAADLQLQK